MPSFKTELAIRTVITVVGTSVLAVVLASEPQARDCKPSMSSAHLKSLEGLILRHDAREAMTLLSDDGARQDQEIAQ